MQVTQIYLSDNNAEPPALLQRYIASVRRAFAHLPHVLYGDRDIQALMNEHFDSRVSAAYNKLIPYAYKSDLARLCIVYVVGGWYFDIGFYCPFPVVQFEPRIKLAAFRENPRLTPYASWSVANGCFMHKQATLSCDGRSTSSRTTAKATITATHPSAQRAQTSGAAPSARKELPAPPSLETSSSSARSTKSRTAPWCYQTARSQVFTNQPADKDSAKPLSKWEPSAPMITTRSGNRKPSTTQIEPTDQSDLHTRHPLTRFKAT